MSQHLAIVVQKKGEAQVAEASVPKLRDDYIIVQTKAIALNPTDWKHVEFIAPPGCRVSFWVNSKHLKFVAKFVQIGCDYAGIVEEVGSKVTKGFKKGDRVCGFVHGGHSPELLENTYAPLTCAKATQSNLKTVPLPLISPPKAIFRSRSQRTSALRKHPHLGLESLR